MAAKRFGLGTPGDDIRIFSPSDGPVIYDGNTGNDIIFGESFADVLLGNDGNDDILGLGGRDILLGGAGADTIDGGRGGDVIQGGLGIDVLAGDFGKDVFVFDATAITDPSTLKLVNLAGTGIDVKVSADAVLDFRFGVDKIQLGLIGFDVLARPTLSTGITAELADGNFIVQLDAFANVALAAQAIAANDAITADAGFFIYFNSTLGFNRLVYSADLGDAGDVTVLANFTDQTGPEGLAAIANWGLDDFLLVG